MARRRPHRDDAFDEGNPADEPVPTGPSPMAKLLVPILVVAGLLLIAYELLGLSLDDIGGPYLLIPVLFIAMLIGRGGLR